MQLEDSGWQGDWCFITEQPAPAPHLAHPEGCAALRIVLVTVERLFPGRQSGLVVTLRQLCTTTGSLGGYSQVDNPGPWYKSVNFGPHGALHGLVGDAHFSGRSQAAGKFGLKGYSQVDNPGPWYKSVNFGVLAAFANTDRMAECMASCPPCQAILKLWGEHGPLWGEHGPDGAIHGLVGDTLSLDDDGER